MDVSESNFQSAVIDRSQTVPVVVDFWAEWCGPCRQLGPMIEQAVAARNGKIELVKVDVDANQGLARSFRIQGIPAVKAFKDGKVAAEFVGAQPPAAIERFLDSLVPSEAELLTGQGDEASLRRALELEPHRADAAIPLARILRTRGEDDQALEVLARVPGSFAADGLAARIALERAAAPGADEAGAAAPSAGEPGSAEPGAVPQGLQALDAGEHERALELLIGALPSADGMREDIRRVVVGILDELGAEHPLARDARRRLAAALY